MGSIVDLVIGVDVRTICSNVVLTSVRLQKLNQFVVLRSQVDDELLARSRYCAVITNIRGSAAERVGVGE